MTVTFEMNGKGYKTDVETLDLLREQVSIGRKNDDFSAVAAMMTLGVMAGRIVQMTVEERGQC